MAMDFDVHWLSLSSSTQADGLDELDSVRASGVPKFEAPTDGRFEALLEAHLQWATSARSAQGAQAQSRVAASDEYRASKIQTQVAEQLARIANMGVAV
ncbi:MAG: hypothetical protein LW629_03245 [Burkholderiales bacterium]|jgi:hypothetical protein|nr:hypothetical protein [Burkholderiales bacterium]